MPANSDDLLTRLADRKGREWVQNHKQLVIAQAKRLGTELSGDEF